MREYYERVIIQMNFILFKSNTVKNNFDGKLFLKN